MPNTASTASRRSHAASHFWIATRAHLSLSLPPPSLSPSGPRNADGWKVGDRPAAAFPPVPARVVVRRERGGGKWRVARARASGLARYRTGRIFRNDVERTLDVEYRRRCIGPPHARVHQRQMWPRVVALRSDTCEETLPSSSSSRAFFHLPSLATTPLVYLDNHATRRTNTLAASGSLTINGSGGESENRSRPIYPSIYLSIYLPIHPSIHPSIYPSERNCIDLVYDVDRYSIRLRAVTRTRERELIVIIDHQRDIYLSVFRYDSDETKSEGSSIVGRRVSIMDGRGS